MSAWSRGETKKIYLCNFKRKKLMKIQTKEQTLWKHLHMVFRMQYSLSLGSARFNFGFSFFFFSFFWFIYRLPFDSVDLFENCDRDFVYKWDRVCVFVCLFVRNVACRFVVIFVLVFGEIPHCADNWFNTTKQHREYVHTESTFSFRRRYFVFFNSAHNPTVANSIQNTYTIALA